MPDQDISQITLATSINSTANDLIYIGRDPGGGSEDDEAITVDNFFKGTHQFELPANVWKPTNTNGASGLVTREIGANNENIEAMAFLDGSDTKAYTRFRMPKFWNLGTIKFSYHWFREDDEATPESKTVEFELAGVVRSNFEQIGSSALPTGVGVSDTTDSTAAENKIMMSGQSANVTIGGTPADNDSVYLEIMRDDSAGTMTGTAYLVTVIIEYSTDGKESIG